MKKCSKCKKELPLSEFWKDKYKKDGLRSACKICNANNKEYLKEYNKRTASERKKYREKNAEKLKASTIAWQKANPERVKLLKRKTHLKKYNLTINDYDKILKNQNNRCAICKKEDKKTLHVDHDHSCCNQRAISCGLCVRGLLCTNCNALLGNARDDITIINNAIEYLKAWSNEKL